MMDLVVWSMMTRFPSSEIASSGEVGLTTGLSPLATHAGVNFGTVLNHMPRYQLEASREEDLLNGWKKPSANLPLLEIRVSLPDSPSPAVMVSFASAPTCREKRRPKKMIIMFDMANYRSFCLLQLWRWGVAAALTLDLERVDCCFGREDTRSGQLLYVTEK